MAWLTRRRLLVATLSTAALYGGAMAAIAVNGLRDQLAPADAIVVPGNTVLPDGQPSPRLRARLDAALEVYRQRLAPLVIVSGGTGREGYDEAAVMAHYLTDHGVPVRAVLVDSGGANTATTAAHVAELARTRQIRSVIVATQYFHVPRTRLSLEAAGLDVAGTTHPDYFEWRDLYSLAREVPAWVAYRMGFKDVQCVSAQCQDDRTAAPHAHDAQQA